MLLCISQSYLPPAPTHKGTRAHIFMHMPAAPMLRLPLVAQRGGGGWGCQTELGSVSLLCRSIIQDISPDTELSGPSGLQHGNAKEQKVEERKQAPRFFHAAYADVCIYLYLSAPLSGRERAGMGGGTSSAGVIHAVELCDEPEVLASQVLTGFTASLRMQRFTVINHKYDAAVYAPAASPV